MRTWRLTIHDERQLRMLLFCCRFHWRMAQRAFRTRRRASHRRMVRTISAAALLLRSAASSPAPCANAPNADQEVCDAAQQPAAQNDATPPPTCQRRGGPPPGCDRRAIATVAQPCRGCAS